MKNIITKINKIDTYKDIEISVMNEKKFKKGQIKKKSKKKKDEEEDENIEEEETIKDFITEVKYYTSDFNEK